MEGRPDLPTRFFKVILPSTTVQKKLRLPNNFVEKYKHELSNVVKLTDRAGGIWRVRLEAEEDTLWLQRGWEKFYVDHSIEYGYFLLFKYTGNSTFKVHVFDMTATEVHYPAHNSRDFQESTRRSVPERDSLAACPLRSVAPNGRVVQARRGKRRVVQLKFPESNEKHGTKRDLRKKAVNFAGTILRTYPSFTVEMRANLTPKWILYVPARFAKDYLPNISGFIELHDSEGKKWPVNVNIRHGLVRYLCWAAFAKAKKIKVGDTCVFELIHGNKPAALKVSRLCNTSGVLRQI